MPGDLRWKLAGLAAAAALLPVVPGRVDDVAHVLVEIVCVALAWRRLVPRRDLLRRGWGVALVAVTMLCVADAAAVAERSMLLGTSFPRPSDLVALAACLVLSAGVFVVGRQRAGLESGNGVIESVVLGLGSLAPALSFLILPRLTEPGRTAAGSVVLGGFAVAVVLLVSVVARFALIDHRGCVSLRLFAGGLLLWCAAEFAESAASGTVSTIGASVWLIGLVLVTAGLCHSSLRELTYGAGLQSLHVVPSRQVWLLGLGSLMPVVSLGLAWALGRPTWLPEIAVLGVLVSGLVWFRFTQLMTHIAEQSDLLSDLARSDELTGLPNRRSWNHEVSRAVVLAQTSGTPLCVALLDLDHFKTFNDTQGHPAGDRLLREVSASWSALLRDGEVLARYGGEEFAMALPGLGLDEALERVDEIRRAVVLPQTASAGVAAWVPGTDPAVTLKDADGALYLAKRSGRNMTLPAEPSTDSTPGPLRDLSTVMQPIVRVSDLEIVAFESLSRFPHTASVEATFLDAHDKGYGDLLEAIALRRAVEEPARPRGVHVFVNVSERAMRSDRFWDALPEDLTGAVIELSEVRDGLATTELREYLDRFRAKGARIGLDDVGTLSADFARIVALRPDIAKIDRSLVTRCDLDRAQAEVLRMLVGFAHSHDVAVCVEGVETAGELEVIRSLDVGYAQGYLLGRPGPGWPGGRDRVERRGEVSSAGRHAAV
ncbi:EAL domain-containing protein [Nocardioides mangrovicus]|uniref:EAL domain-containing protein n=1 Tax=Nocardioides mangrovicus TaxID=2478913 RepID=A0A3L8NZD1_9ACTN|nr:GGDEF and EAL domain-containing protein [Nocardioides mangrovicus]RLV48274.1 EAL domain-containing protein [Nocardioides mangrovicus]